MILSLIKIIIYELRGHVNMFRNSAFIKRKRLTKRSAEPFIPGRVRKSTSSKMRGKRHTGETNGVIIEAGGGQVCSCLPLCG